MIYARFYQMSTGYVEGTIPPVFREDAKRLIEAPGDRATLRLDGRMSDANLRAIAADECKKRGFLAWHIEKGDSLLNAKRVTRVHSVEGKTDLETISARINARGE